MLPNLAGSDDLLVRNQENHWKPLSLKTTRSQEISTGKEITSRQTVIKINATLITEAAIEIQLVLK